MRVDPNLSSILNSGIQSTQQALQTSVQQLSSGLSVSTPSDNPYAEAADIRSLAQSANVDTYTQNGDTVLAQAQMADSTLSSVVTQLTQAVSLGTEGANGTTSTEDRSAIAAQVQDILQQVISLANTQYSGANLFAGTAGVSQAFAANSASPGGYSYEGNSGVNQVAIGEGLNVNTNIPGDQIFTNPDGNVLGSLSQLASALSTGSTADIATATAAVSSAISIVDQQRAVYGGTVNEINAQESYLSQETVSLTSQQQNLTGIDMATVISNMTQAQTANSALLAAAAKVLPTSLLDYLN